MYRLPTEAEWEYACRAGSTTQYHFGDDASMLGEYAWYEGNLGKQTRPVGDRRPNAWGLCDMYGSVWEWCSDWYGDYASTMMTDPGGPTMGSSRIARGGAWSFTAGVCRSAFRAVRLPSHRGSALGFRVAFGSVD